MTQKYDVVVIGGGHNGLVAAAYLTQAGLRVQLLERLTQVGGAAVKGLLSRTAGRTLGTFARVGTDDATNSFKAYDTEFVRAVGIHSRSGFEIGLELTAKARRLRLPVAELPTIWLDRKIGSSNFDMRRWIPKYLQWYRFAFGPRLTPEQVRRHAEAIARRDERKEGGT